MRKFISIALIVFILPFLNKGYGQNIKDVSNSSDKQIIETLKTFYKEYITENDKMPVNEKKIDLIKKKYCTNSLIAKIKKDVLDYDPLVNAQDISREFLKTMKITKDSKMTNSYVVCFNGEYNKIPFCVKLLVLKTREGFKIDKAY